MTPAQETAFHSANRLLSEHFESSVIVVEGTVVDDEDSKSDVVGIYHGGFCAAIGLLEHHKSVLLSQPAKRTGTIEDKDDE
jgi:hypothetical protein